MCTCKTVKESAPPTNDEPIQAMLNTRNRAKSSRLSISMKCYDNISNQVYATYVRSKLAPFAYIVHINFKYWTTPPNMCMWPNCRYTTFSFKVMTIIIHRHKWRLQSWFNPKTLTHASHKRFSIQLFFFSFATGVCCYCQILYKRQSHSTDVENWIETKI